MNNTILDCLNNKIDISYWNIIFGLMLLIIKKRNDNLQMKVAFRKYIPLTIPKYSNFIFFSIFYKDVLQTNITNAIYSHCVFFRTSMYTRCIESITMSVFTHNWTKIPAIRIFLSIATCKKKIQLL